ncbi:MAG: hypothetical protein IPP72_08435 [Chitinophagaceae bacterium]|nr:hypothetical protein [Chitinophagaceae bacterium]
MKRIFLHLFITTIASLAIMPVVTAQNSYTSLKASSTKATGAFSKVEDSLRKQFETKKLIWPPQQVYVRSFKYDRQVEVWVKGKTGEQFKLFKTYRMCMQSGTIGPKRMEGDYQMPEGFITSTNLSPTVIFI